MAHVERSLLFWQRQLRAGSHTSFMLLGRGPRAFARDLSRLLQPSLRVLLAWLRQAAAAAAAAAAQGAQGSAGAAPEGGADGRRGAGPKAAALLEQMAAGVEGAAARAEEWVSSWGAATAWPDQGSSSSSSSGGGAPRGGLVSSSSSAGWAGPGGQLVAMSATNKIQQRVLVLEALQSALAEAVAKVG